MKVYCITVSTLSKEKNRSGGDIWKVEKIWVTGKRRMKKMVEAIRGISKDRFIEVMQIKKEVECNDKWSKKWNVY